MVRLISIIILIFSFDSCAGGSPRVRDFQQVRDKSETFYWPCKEGNFFCSKTCIDRKRNGQCDEWLHRKPINVNDEQDWNLLKNGDFILIKRKEVFK